MGDGQAVVAAGRPQVRGREHGRAGGGRARTDVGRRVPRPGALEGRMAAPRRHQRAPAVVEADHQPRRPVRGDVGEEVFDGAHADARGVVQRPVAECGDDPWSVHPPRGSLQAPLILCA
jgi:hypothetical protein